LLNFQDSQTEHRDKLKKTPLEIFNEVYAICDHLEKEKHPEQIAFKIWDRVESKLLLCETSIIFSCVYVILLFSENKNSNLNFFLTRIKQRIDIGYFQEFEPLIIEELKCITVRTDSFDFLKNIADKITDLNKRKLVYAKCLAHYKQIKDKGDIVMQMVDEVSLINQIIMLSAIEKQATNQETEGIEKNESGMDVASIKVRSVVILELLKLLQLGTAHNDLTKICRLIAFLTGNSYRSIYKAVQEGISFSEFYNKQIESANKILLDLKSPISIDINGRY